MSQFKQTVIAIDKISRSCGTVTRGRNAVVTMAFVLSHLPCWNGGVTRINHVVRFYVKERKKGNVSEKVVNLAKHGVEGGRPKRGIRATRRSIGSSSRFRRHPVVLDAQETR